MKEAIRILHVIGRMDRGGAETMLMNLYRQIDRSQIQFDFMVHTTEKGAFDDEITSLGGKIHRVPRYRGINHMSYRKSWISFFKKHKEYRIIHAHLTTTAAIFLPIAKRYNVKTIAHAHNNVPLSHGVSAIVKNVLRFPLRYIADYFFACSDAAGVRLCGKKFHKTENCFSFYNAIDVDEFCYNPSIRESKRREMNIENKLVVGHVGRFSVVKNHNFLVEVFNQMRTKCEHAVLLLVGDGSERQRIEQKVDELGLSEHVMYLGIRQDIDQLLQIMDIFIFPSFSEGLALAIIEAQASGLYCLVSDGLPLEARITPLLERLSLKEGATYWADVAIRGFKENGIRQDMTDQIKAAGYDIKETTKWLHQFYSEVYTGI